MLLTLRILIGFVGLIGLVTGSIWFLSGLGTLQSPFGYSLGSSHSPSLVLIDNTFRFFGAVWLTIGVGLLISIRNPHHYTDIFRLAVVAVFLGGIGRIISAVSVGISPEMIGPTLLELILAPIMVWLHWKTAPQTQHD